jgi:monoamine oxidase
MPVGNTDNGSGIATDILVVGAGMAGLYSAWRLTQAGREVRIVEQLHRIGGRLDTDHVDIRGVPVQTEEGGMRFMSTQLELQALIRELNLDVVNFPMGSDNNFYFLRGRRFSFGEAKANPGIWGELYNLDDASKQKQPGEILWLIRNAILKENGQDPATWVSSPQNWTDFRLKYTYRGVPTYRWGFWALLDDYGLSQDAIEMLYQSSGFVAPYDQRINAGCAFQLVADFINPQFSSLREGYSALPNALGERLSGKVPIHLGHEVHAIDRLADGRLRVRAHGPDGDNVFVCRTLILAVTQLALQRLTPFAPVLRDNPAFARDVESVADMPLGKINLYYAANWWTPRFGIHNGPCFTDLPLAMFYCFNQPQAAGTSNGPNAITIYTDYYRSNFWSELQEMGEPFQSKDFPVNPEHTVAASTSVVAAITRQMKLMFGMDDIPAPVLTTYKVWIDPRMGDGDHQWLIGVVDTDVRSRMTCPVPDVHVCGESYSDDQAWVNGALRSVDEMLSAHFALPAPDLHSVTTPSP